MGKKSALDTLAENVESLRAVVGNPSSQAAIAKDAGVDQKTISRILNKTNCPSIDVLDGLAKAFKCEPWQLVTPKLDAARAVRLLRLSPVALEVAELFDALPPRRRRLLYAHIQDMHNPDGPEADTGENQVQPVS